MLVWDFNTPVPIKYISDPEMHSIPFVATHPSGTEVSLSSSLLLLACV